MPLLPMEGLFGIPLRKCVIYCSILEILIFISPALAFFIAWDDVQQSNRMLNGIILIIVLMLSVFLLIGAYSEDALFIVIWIVGTVLVQFVVNIFYGMVFLFSLSSQWGHSLPEFIVTIIQTVIGIGVMWIVIAYYTLLRNRDRQRSLVRIQTGQKPSVERSKPQDGQLKPIENERQVTWKSELHDNSKEQK